MIIILIGPPGSGKSTQGKLLSKKLKIPNISMGQVLRDAEEAGTILGKEAAKFVEEGELVPSRIMEALTRFRLEEEDCKNGFILDGAPRRVEEAVVLDNYLKRRGKKIEKIILINLSDEEVIKRLLLRANLPEKMGGGRADDNREDIKVRLQEYKDNIDPVKIYYSERDLLKIVDGVGTIEEVNNRISNVLKI